jgi:hypothetical protein
VATVARAGRFDHLEAADLLQLGAQLRQCLLELLRALADRLRRRPVDQQQRHIIERLALLADHDRIGERQQAQRQHRAAPERAARPPPQAEPGDERDCECQRAEHRPGQERGETERGAADHCPRRSSSAGMCTWSVL